MSVKHVKALAVLCCVILLCGCVTANYASPDQSSTGAQDASDAAHPKQLLSSSFQLARFGPGWFYKPTACCTQGAYISAGITRDTFDSGTEFVPVQAARILLYMDFDKLEIREVPDHELTITDLWSTLVCDGEYLYGFYFQYDGEMSYIPEYPYSYIFRTDLDGHNRQEIALPDAWNAFCPYSSVAEYDGKLYFAVMSDTDSALARADFDSGAIELLYTASRAYAPYNFRFLGVDGQDLIVSVAVYKEKHVLAREDVLAYSPADGSLRNIDDIPAQLQDRLDRATADSPEHGKWIICETETDYLVWADFRTVDFSIYVLKPNQFPRYQLVAKAEFENSIDSGRSFELLC